MPVSLQAPNIRLAVMFGKMPPKKRFLKKMKAKRRKMRGDQKVCAALV